MTLGTLNTGLDEDPVSESERLAVNEFIRKALLTWEVSEPRCDRLDLVRHLNMGVAILLCQLRRAAA